MTTEQQDKCYVDGLHGLLNILEQRASLDVRLSPARLADLERCLEQLATLVATFVPGQAHAPMHKFDSWILRGLHTIVRLLSLRVQQPTPLVAAEKHRLLDLIFSLKKLLQS